MAGHRDKINRLHIYTFKAIMGKRKNIKWQIEPLIFYEYVGGNTGMQRICDDSFGGTLMEDQSSFGLFSIGDSNLNLQILRTLRNVDLKDQKWLKQMQVVTLIWWGLNLRRGTI